MSARGSARSSWIRELEALCGGDVPERALDVVAQVAEADVADVDRDRAGLDLREVEDVVDEARRSLPDEWIVFANSTCFVREVPVGVLARAGRTG